MATRVVIVVAPGTPVRLDDDCPTCGWSDLWQIAIHSLTEHGVGILAHATRCARCGHRETTRRP